MADDFAPLSGPAKKQRVADSDAGQERVWLKIFETAPCQMLNAYGQAKHVSMDDRAVWDAMIKPLKSGAKYMTEYASEEAERRGIAVNRYLKSLEDYLRYQQSAQGIQANEFVMKPEVLKEFNAEIARILPSVSYCLAPKKVSQKSGASVLRSQPVSAPTSDRNTEELDRHAQILYDWLDLKKPSRIRMMLGFQSAGGLPYVAHCHHRCTQCFRYHGASGHSNDRSEATLAEWQQSIRARHALGSTGIAADGNGTDDFRSI